MDDATSPHLIHTSGTGFCVSPRSAIAARQTRAALLQAVANGTISAVTTPVELLLRNSEVLWHHCPAWFEEGNVTAEGRFYVTSLRVTFVSPERPFEVPLANLNAVRFEDTTLHLLGKSAAGSRSFAMDDPELAAAHVARVVRVYHRQVDVGFEPNEGRQIPQDVKTAVWQRDGGRCVECGATDYLEYDHVIPHAKGGANTVDNVQLLCRRCNLKKGAAI